MIMYNIACQCNRGVEQVKGPQQFPHSLGNHETSVCVKCQKLTKTFEASLGHNYKLAGTCLREYPQSSMQIKLPVC